MESRRPRRQPKPKPFLLLSGVHLVLFLLIFAGFAAWNYRLVSVYSEVPGRAWLAAALAWLGPFTGPLTGVCGDGCLSAALGVLPLGLSLLIIGWVGQLGRLPIPSMLRTVSWALGWGLWFVTGAQVLLATYAAQRG